MIGSGAPGDIDACVALWVAAVRARQGGTVPDGTAERCRTKLSRPAVSFAVARSTGEAGDRIDGFGLVTGPGTGMAADPPDAAYLALLGVAPDAQGRGVGARLLERLVSDARATGHAALVLHVLTSNTAAVRLYESRGWRAVGPAFPHPLTGAPSQTFELRFG